MKTMKYFMMLLCATLFFASCKDDDETTTVAVTGVTISKTTLALVAGGSETLTATVTPKDATEQTVAWSSDKTAIATVDATGKVSAVAAGTATITVTTKDGGKIATCAVTVTPATIAVTGVTVNKPTLTLEVGTKETLTATIAPADATNKTVAWMSDKAAIATVNATTGEVTAIAVGTAVITATTADGAKTATCTVTVEAVKPKFGNEGQPGIDGSSWDKAYTIANKEHFLLLATRVNGNGNGIWNTKYYKQTADIDFSNNNTDTWPTIGKNSNYVFKGHFDGGNYSIKGKFIANATAVQYGLFGETDGAEIKNIRFEGSIDLSLATQLSQYVGSIIARMSGGMIVNCSNTADITSPATAGGIVGGIAGGNSKIMACINTGNIDASANDNKSGGIAGESPNGLIGCINKGNITTDKFYVGGITAMGTAVACWSKATAITSKSSFKGCIIGNVSSNISATTSDCYWKEISGLKGAGSGTITNGASFAGDKPDASQITAMNAAWAEAQPTGREYQFNATTGEIEKIAQ